jgi:hypothetical protein
LRTGVITLSTGEWRRLTGIYATVAERTSPAT